MVTIIMSQKMFSSTMLTDNFFQRLNFFICIKQDHLKKYIQKFMIKIILKRSTPNKVHPSIPNIKSEH